MAMLKILISLAILAIVAPRTLAKDYIVGDENGWKLNFNYTAWAQDKEFWVGDRLSMFNILSSYIFNLEFYSPNKKTSKIIQKELLHVTELVSITLKIYVYRNHIWRLSYDIER